MKAMRAAAFGPGYQQAGDAPAFFTVPRTVSQPDLFDPRNLRFERKQIPRFVGIVNS